VLEPRGSSLGFLPLQRTKHEESTFDPPGFPRPDYAPPPGFLTLLTASLLLEPCRLVSSDSRSWDCTLQSLSPPWQPLRLSAPVAVLVSTTAPEPPRPRTIRPLLPWKRRACVAHTGDGQQRRPTFTALLHQRVRHSAARGLDARRVRSSPGFASSSGVLPPRLGTRFRVPPPTDSAFGPFLSTEADRLGPGLSPGVSIGTKVGRPLSRPAAPHEVFLPCHAPPWFTFPSAPGSWLHLGLRPGVTTGPGCLLRHRENVPPKSPESDCCR